MSDYMDKVKVHGGELAYVPRELDVVVLSHYVGQNREVGGELATPTEETWLKIEMKVE